MRRRLTRELDTQIADWREEALNDILASAWDEFVTSLESGQKIELEGDYKAFVRQALEEQGIKAKAVPQ